jgi:hypothetical protein
MDGVKERVETMDRRALDGPPLIDGSAIDKP